MNTCKKDRKVPTEEFTKARDLFDALDVTSHRWLPTSKWKSPWAYRGQRNSEWGIIPRAWRSDNSPELQRLEILKRRIFEERHPFIQHKLNQVNPNCNPKEIEWAAEAYCQAKAETELVVDFIKFADELGHPIPGGNEYIKSVEAFKGDYTLERELEKYPFGSPPYFLPDPNSATALAQHHGIPTRTIDWTHNPLIAAFFAAEDAIQNSGDGCMAVWAVRHDKIDEYSRVNLGDRTHSKFYVLQCPRGENTFLHAQEGFFIYPRYGCAYFAQNGCWPTLEQYAMDVTYKDTQINICKLVLPNSQAPELLRLLWASGISRGHLMPEYDNVTKSLIIKWECWDY